MLAINLTLIYVLISIAVLILVDVILGVSVSLIKTKDFDFNKLPKFLATQVLPYYLTSFALVMASQIDYSFLASNVSVITTTTLTGLAWTAVGSYVIKLLKEIGEKIFIIFGVNPVK